MKTGSKKAAAGKVASWSIVAVVAVGALAISGVADVSQGSGILSKLFFFFLGSVIVLQVVPGLVLFGALAKGIGTLAVKGAKVSIGKGRS